MIDISEIEDFESIVLANGYDVTDFKLTERRNEPPSLNGIYSLTGYVDITNTQTEKFKTYSTGDRSAWPVEFESDLENGYFQ